MKLGTSMKLPALPRSQLKPHVLECEGSDGLLALLRSDACHNC
jgi:hypothetical protein